MLELPLVKPLKVTRKHCVDHDEIRISPAGDWIGWWSPLPTEAPVTFGGGTARRRMRAIEFATGNLGPDVIANGCSCYDFRVVRDVANGRVREVPLASCLFRGGNELVCLDGDSVAVIDLDAR